MQELRGGALQGAGVSETLDWVAALVALDRDSARSRRARGQTLGVVLKARRTTSRRSAASGWPHRARRIRAARYACERDLSSQPAARSAGLLRAPGLDVHTGRMLDVIEALQHVDTARRATRSTTRAARCSSIATRTCRSSTARSTPSGATSCNGDATIADSSRPAAERGPATQTDAAAGAGRRSAIAARWRGDEAIGNVERRRAALPHKDFAEFTPRKTLAAARRARAARMDAGRAPHAPLGAGRGPAHRPAARAARSLRTGGDVVTLPRARRRRAAAARAALRRQRLDGALLAHAPALRARARPAPSPRRGVPVLDPPDARHHASCATARLDEAVRCRARAVPDWSGGTRIGERCARFTSDGARRVLHGGPVVLLISDGWDRGDPIVLREQMSRRLQRSCHRLIWLNPLIGTLDYAPLTRGLQAALPFVDDFLPGADADHGADLEPRRPGATLERAVGGISHSIAHGSSTAPTPSTRRPSASGTC